MADMTPMPLETAVQVCFPHGGATVSTLRRAIRAGELAAEIIGRGYMVTARAVQDWRENTCHARAKARASISGRGRGKRPSMLSETEKRKLALDALQRMLTGPAKPCGITSQTTSGPTRANAASTG